MEARRGGQEGVRHLPGRVPEHAADDRGRALREHALQPRRRARGGHRQGAVGLRSEVVRGRPAGQRPGLHPSRRRRVARPRRPAHLPEHPPPADLPRRQDRPAGDLVRHGRRDRSRRGAALADRAQALLEHLAAGRLSRPGHPRQRHRRSADVQERPAGRHPRLRRPHRQAGVELPHHPAAGRVRPRNLAGRGLEVHRPHQRLAALHPRRRARPGLPAGEHAEQRLLRRPPARPEPLRRDAALPRRQDRQAQVALPAGAPRAVGLRPAVAAQPGHHPRQRPAHRRRRAADQAGLRLRLRSRHRPAGVAD